jgi:hypothetical protein
LFGDGIPAGDRRLLGGDLFIAGQRHDLLDRERAGASE